MVQNIDTQRAHPHTLRNDERPSKDQTGMKRKRCSNVYLTLILLTSVQRWASVVNVKALSHECRILPHRPTHEKRMSFNA